MLDVASEIRGRLAVFGFEEGLAAGISSKMLDLTVWDLHCAADNACDIINEIELLIHRLAEEVKGKKALSQAKGSSKHTGLLHNHYSWFQSPVNMLFN